MLGYISKAQAGPPAKNAILGFFAPGPGRVLKIYPDARNFLLSIML